MPLVLPPNKRVVPVASTIVRANGAFTTANPGGPAGTSLMTFFCIFRQRRLTSTNEVLFGRFDAGNAGWAIWVSAGNLSASVANSTPALVTTPATSMSTTVLVGVPVIYIARYSNGTNQAWLNGTSVGTTTLGTGYTAFSGPTTIGSRPTAANYPAQSFEIMECGMLDAFDISGTVSTVNSQWQEDLQQGRPLTWPRSAAANSDWYWSMRDAVIGIGTRSTFNDRYTSVAMTRNAGMPEAAQSMPKF